MTTRVAIGLRRQLARVGAPAGFAQVFKGWNVWDVWQAQDPIEGLGGAILNAGVSLERQLRIWVEDWLREHAPAAAVADTANPFALKGSQVEIVSNPGGLELLQTRADVPGFAGALQVGKEGSAAKKVTVRFFNRGEETATDWPHDENYLLDSVYQPSATNALTSGAAPGSLAGAAGSAADAAATTLKVVAIGGSVVLAVVLIASLVNSSRKAAA